MNGTASDAHRALTQLHILGFRSLRHVTLTPGRVTVLIGPNGAGKSNLVGALHLLHALVRRSLRRYVADAGGASRVLHFGPKSTPSMKISLDFHSDERAGSYAVTLSHDATDSLYVRDEIATLATDGDTTASTTLASDEPEARLLLLGSRPDEDAARHAFQCVSRIGLLHVHDTSERSALRQNGHAADTTHLRPDGGNLAAVLYHLATSAAPDARAAWRRIESLMQRVAPYVKALEPELLSPEAPESSAVRLRWTDQRDHRFDVADLSDGTLRALALFTALAQPASSLPAFLCIDEPELGLHPAAINLLVELIRSVSDRCQVMLATQSPALLDHFAPEEVVVVEQHDGETSLRRLDPAALEGWLEDYRLSELYDKNVLGGRP